MIELPFSCRCSDLKVSPKNWHTNKASIKKDWLIYYRFYDPEFKHDPKLCKGKLVIIKGMNHFKTIPERQFKTKDLLQLEMERLKNKGYNPITGVGLESTQPCFEINPDTGFILALDMAEKRISASNSTKRDLRSILKQVTVAAKQLRYSELPVKLVTRKHLKQVLTQIDHNLGESPHRYNKVRSYLMILYKELIELEAVDTNPIRDLSKKKIVVRLRKLPSVDNRVSINNYLKENHYRFWLFMQIFFHSGSRLTELIKVQRKHVDLINQTFIVTVKKGNCFKEVIKPIKNIAVDYWMEAVKSAGENDFIFSKGLIPGKSSIQSYQITKRWYRHIKKKLEITDDFYSLKHLNLDETAAILDINAAAAMASHTSTAITLKHYAVNETSRQNNRLKQVENKFA